MSEAHHHDDAIDLGDGFVVIVRSHPSADYDPDRAVDFGLYFDERWQPPWAHRHVEWPDFGLPADPELLVDELRELLDRARAERVEIGCLGGHGRTGVALALMAALAGVADDPVTWVREHHCPLAIETEAQEDFVSRVSESVRPRHGGES